MALFLTAVLVVSSVGMVSVLLIKRYELNSGRVLFGGVRPRVGSFFTRNLKWVEEALPSMLSNAGRRAYLYVRHNLERGAAFAVIFLEQGLIRVLRTLRRSTSAPAAKESSEASPFLREVAEHKKKILEDRTE